MNTPFQSSVSQRQPARPGHQALKLALAGATLAMAATAAAHHVPGHEDHHHHKHKQGHVHQHGLGTLDISQQADTLTVNFRSPLDSLIGFETVPADDQQRAKAKALLAQLQDGASVVQIPAAAQCTQQAPVINAPTLTGEKAADGDDHDEDHHDADDHDDDHHDHDHDADDHHDADEHHHHHHGHHADLAITYTFSCKQPAAIDALTVTAFSHWPRLKHIDTAVVNDHGQQAQRLDPSKAVIRWKAS